MEAYNMATSFRHNELTAMFYTEIASRSRKLIEKKSLRLFTEEVPLVHYGSMQVPDLRLVDIKNISDIKYFTNKTINDLSYVQPDLFLFKNNDYLVNERENRIAGFPDLVVEVWSDSNDRWERSQKFSLYSSSPITEHWYIDQDSNIVECYLGKNRLKNQFLKDILKTQDDIIIDVTYLAL